MKLKSFFLLSTLLFCGIGAMHTSMARADAITKPNTFVDGENAVAADVNENFNILYDQVNKIGTEINIDSVNSRVGIGKATPTTMLDVNGTITAVSFSGDGASLANLTAANITGLSTEITSKQDRVTGTCTVGSSIRAIAENGTVTCQTDNTNIGDITGVAAGSGLTGGGTVGAVTLSIPTGGITSAHIATSTVTGTDIANGSITDTDIADEPGVKYYEKSYGTNILTTSGQLASVSINIPTSGYVIVTASGTLYMNVTSTGTKLVRLKVDDVSGNTSSEDAGSMHFYYTSSSASESYSTSYSKTKVFYASSAGSKTYYLNGWNQLLGCDPSISHTSLVAIFVPTLY